MRVQVKAPLPTSHSGSSPMREVRLWPHCAPAAYPFLEFPPQFHASHKVACRAEGSPSWNGKPSYKFLRDAFKKSNCTHLHKQFFASRNDKRSCSISAAILKLKARETHSPRRHEKTARRRGFCEQLFSGTRARNNAPRPEVRLPLATPPLKVQAKETPGKREDVHTAQGC